MPGRARSPQSLICFGLPLRAGTHNSSHNPPTTQTPHSEAADDRGGSPNAGDWLYVYLLLEFQSSNDAWMAVRILTYIENGNDAAAATVAVLLLIVALAAIIVLQVLSARVARRG